MSVFRFRKRSVVVTWLISYLAVLLLPIVLSLFVYRESSSALNGEINSATRSLLQQLKEVTDGQLGNMTRLSFEMTWNVKVQELFYSGKYRSSQNEYNYDLYRITQDLKLYQSSYAFIDDFYIYVAPDGKVLLPGLMSDGKMAYEREHQSADFSYDQWLDTMRQSDVHKFVPMVRVGDDGKPRRMVAYLSSYPPKDGKAPAGMNVIMIDQSRIVGAVDNVELFNKGKVLILNRDNEILLSSGALSDEPSLQLPYDRLAGDAGFFFIREGGRKYEVSYVVSPSTDTKYVSIIPSTLFWEKSNKVRNLTYASLLVSMLGGGMLTFFFLRKNYGPVRRLLRMMSEKSGGQSEEGDEFRYIESAMGRAFSEMDRMTLHMRRNRPELRSNFIARLLRGQGESAVQMDDLLSVYDMKFDSDEFSVLLFLAEENQPFYDSLDGLSPGEKLRLLPFIVANVVEDVAGRKHNGYVAQMDEVAACLVNFASSGQDERMDDLLEMAREAQLFLQRAYKIQLTVSVGTVRQGLAGIHQAYVDALDALEYKLVVGRKEIIAYDQIPHASPLERDTLYYYPLAVEQMMINYVKTGDYDRAKVTLDTIIEENLGKRLQSVQVAKCLMFDLISTLIKTINEIGDVQEAFVARNSKAIEALMSSGTIRDMHRELSDILRQVCEYTSARRLSNLQDNRRQAVRSMVEEAAAFIEARSGDVNLNISAIGEHMDLKPAYISRLFKEEMGIGLLDYIARHRVSRAKEAIAQRRMTVQEAAGYAGFADATSFIRTFKKYEGITPGKYKESLPSEEEE